MPTLSVYLWFLLTAALIVVIPGPSVLFIVGRSLALGRRAGLLSVIGNNLGLCALVTAVAFGVGALITASHVAFLVLKTAGALYLVYLGVQTIRHRRQAAGPPSAAARRRVFAQSFTVGFTNPKTLAFYVAVLPQFVPAGAGAAALQIELFGLTFNALALVNDSVWALVAGTARDWFARRPQRTERLAATGGTLMIGLGVALAAVDNTR
jgi:threonine/homoserine/homoserine lactone efflux protein